MIDDGSSEQSASPWAESHVGATAVLRFRVGERWLGTDAQAVQRIDDRIAASPVLCAPSAVAGICDIAGKATPVVDLAQLFGLAPQAAPGGAGSDPFAQQQRVLWVKSGEEVLGLICDQVRSVGFAPALSVAPDTSTPLGSYAAGYVGVEGEALMLLDLAKMFRHVESLLAGGKAAAMSVVGAHADLALIGIGGQKVAIDAAHVSSIIALRVLRQEGSSLPEVDLAARLGLAPGVQEDERWALRVQSERGDYVLVVAGQVNLVRGTSILVQDLPPTLRGLRALAGVIALAKVGEAWAHVLDPEWLY